VQLIKKDFLPRKN